MGPMASAVLLELITEYTTVSKDEEHIVVDMVSNPRIPDRTEYILGKSDKNPAPIIKSIREELEARGCKVIAIPCNTAFCLYDEISEGSRADIINPVTETVRCLSDLKVKCAGIMATDGTISTKIFQNALRHSGIEPVTPSTEAQKTVMYMIYRDVKQGKPIKEEDLRAVEEDLRSQGAEVIILGCTELSMAKRAGLCEKGYIDTLEVIAKVAVDKCR